MEKFLMAGVTAVRVKDTGTGDRTVVLLHGYLESLDVWEDFQEALSAHARVVSLDLPGHGISEVVGEVHTMEFLADTVHALLERLGIARAVVVGHSMGGYVALELLRKYPAAVEGIVLFHSGPDPDPDRKKSGYERERNLIQAGKKELIARMFPQAAFAPHNRRRLADKVEDLAEQIALTEDEGIVALLHGMERRREQNDTLLQSSVPYLFIMGRHDEYITPEIAMATLVKHPRAEAVWLEDSGHMGFIEEPEKSLEVILEFLTSLPA
jgi:pimeloyl-ACP methyl ester carboxylesterase